MFFALSMNQEKPEHLFDLRFPEGVRLRLRHKAQTGFNHMQPLASHVLVLVTLDRPFPPELLKDPSVHSTKHPRMTGSG